MESGERGINPMEVNINNLRKEARKRTKGRLFSITVRYRKSCGTGLKVLDRSVFEAIADVKRNVVCLDLFLFKNDFLNGYQKKKELFSGPFSF